MLEEKGTAVILDTGDRFFSGEIRYSAGWHHLRVTCQIMLPTLETVDNGPFPAHDLLGDDKFRLVPAQYRQVVRGEIVQLWREERPWYIVPFSVMVRNAEQ